MRSTLRAFILAALVAGAPDTALAREPAERGQRVPTRAELGQCPHLAPVDWRRVARDLAAWRRAHPAAPYDVDAEHRMIRGPWPIPDLSRAEIAIDIAIGPGETQEYPTSTSAFVWREPGGQWQVDRVDSINTPPDPPPPGAPGMTQDDIERAMHPLTRGPLSAEQAATIDRILADPCFAIQPDVTPFSLPLRGGRIDQCSGAISRTIRIRRGAEARNVTDLCARWPSAGLANAVMYAAIPLATVIEQAAQARFPGKQFRIDGLREGRRWGMSPVFCGQINVDGRTLPMVFSRWYDHGRYRNDFYVEGDGEFDYYWGSRCATEGAATGTPGG